MPYKFEHRITNYKGEDSYTHKYYQLEHTTIGMIKAKNMALAKYYELFPNADEEQYLKFNMSVKFVPVSDIPDGYFDKMPQ